MTRIFQLSASSSSLVDKMIDEEEKMENKTMTSSSRRSMSKKSNHNNDTITVKKISSIKDDEEEIPMAFSNTTTSSTDSYEYEEMAIHNALSSPSLIKDRSFNRHKHNDRLIESVSSSGGSTPIGIQQHHNRRNYSPSYHTLKPSTTVQETFSISEAQSKDCALLTPSTEEDDGQQQHHHPSESLFILSTMNSDDHHFPVLEKRDTDTDLSYIRMLDQEPRDSADSDYSDSGPKSGAFFNIKSTIDRYSAVLEQNSGVSESKEEEQDEVKERREKKQSHIRNNSNRTELKDRFTFHSKKNQNSNPKENRHFFHSKKSSTRRKSPMCCDEESHLVDPTDDNHTDLGGFLVSGTQSWDEEYARKTSLFDSHSSSLEEEESSSVAGESSNKHNEDKGNDKSTVHKIKALMQDESCYPNSLPDFTGQRLRERASTFFENASDNLNSINNETDTTTEKNKTTSPSQEEPCVDFKSIKHTAKIMALETLFKVIFKCGPSA